MKRNKMLLCLILGSIMLTGCGNSSAKQQANASAEESGKKSEQPDTSIVYFTKDISAEGLLKVYEKIKQNIGGKVAIKIHTGEPNGPNILSRDMVKALQQSIPNSALVETNVYYSSPRQTTQGHREVLKTNGWTFCDVDIMDEDGAVMLPVKGGKHFKEMSIGKNMINYDSMVVLTHFKGHTMGGFGGSMKNIAIGNADGKVGKKLIHSDPGAGQWSISGGRFMENMAESAKATTDYFGEKIVYINVMNKMSVDCDCAGIDAAPPKAPDIGILASTDLLAIDKAAIDMVYALDKAHGHDLRERIESREGLRQLTYMKELKMGNDHYELVSLD